MKLTAFLAGVALAVAGAQGASPDVVVVAATPGGVAAAVAAARSGASVVLLEESSHVGGIVAGGLTNTDIHKKAAVGGLFAEFVRRVREHYTQTYGTNSQQARLCQGGHMFEPKVAEQVFRAMLAGEKNLQLIQRLRVISAWVQGADGIKREAIPGQRKDGAEPGEFGSPTKLVSLVAENLDQPGQRKTLHAAVFIDATYEGDVSALAGVPYRVGRESRATFGEPHAGRVYVRFGTSELLPGSTGEADDGVQAFCFRFHLTKDRLRSVPIEKPASFQRADYQHLLSDIRAGRITKLTQAVQFYPTPNGKCEINSDHPHPDTGVPSESLDLAEENWTWPEAGPAERARMFQRYWAYQEGLMWLLQHDDAVPESIRQEALNWGFPTDEFTDNRHRPHAIYVRQGRRIWGEYNLTQRDAELDPATKRPRRQADGIAVAEFPFDSHAVHKFDPAHPGVREGYFYVAHEPIQLPYGILVPRRVDRLLVPVACSASHVGYQTLRVEPVFIALGEACGIAAKAALDAGVEVRRVDVKAVQREILKRGGVILYESKPLRPDNL